MKKYFHLPYKLIIATGVVLLVASVLLASPAKAITWGEPDTDNIYSNVGAMVVDWPSYGPNEFCSGTLIAPTVFLTAGHCTAILQEEIAAGRLAQSMITVSFSPDNIYDPSTWIVIDQLITHPLYGSGIDGDNVYDVGLLILGESVDLPLATLPEPGFLDALRGDGVLRDGPGSAEFIAVGYGQTIDWPQAVRLDNGAGRWYVESSFQALTHSLLILFKNNNFDYGGTCYGDSGGPTFFEYEGELWLVGIHSMSNTTCVAMSFDYRTDIAETLDFVAPFLP
jgi:hypothetical protein